MTGKEYLTTHMRLIEMGKIAESLDLISFMKCIENAQAMTPVMAPEVAKKMNDSLDAVKALTFIAATMKEAYARAYPHVSSPNAVSFMKDNRNPSPPPPETL